eukprot:6667609-Prymnesium_polylepis.1
MVQRHVIRRIIGCMEPPVRFSMSVTFSERNIMRSDAELSSSSKKPISCRRKACIACLRSFPVSRLAAMPKKSASSVNVQIESPQMPSMMLDQRSVSLRTSLADNWNMAAKSSGMLTKANSGMPPEPTAKRKPMPKHQSEPFCIAMMRFL